MKNAKEITISSKVRISLTFGFVIMFIISSFFSGIKARQSENLFFIPDFAVDFMEKSDENDEKIRIIEIDDNVETDFYFLKIFESFF